MLFRFQTEAEHEVEEAEEVGTGGLVSRAREEHSGGSEQHGDEQRGRDGRRGAGLRLTDIEHHTSVGVLDLVREGEWVVVSIVVVAGGCTDWCVVNDDEVVHSRHQSGGHVRVVDVELRAQGHVAEIVRRGAPLVIQIHEPVAAIEDEDIDGRAVRLNSNANVHRALNGTPCIIAALLQARSAESGVAVDVLSQCGAVCATGRGRNLNAARAELRAAAALLGARGEARPARHSAIHALERVARLAVDAWALRAGS